MIRTATPGHGQFKLASHPHTKFHLLPSFESSKRLLRKACKREKKIETLRLAICNGAGHPWLISFPNRELPNLPLPDLDGRNTEKAEDRNIPLMYEAMFDAAAYHRDKRANASHRVNPFAAVNNLTRDFNQSLSPFAQKKQNSSKGKGNKNQPHPLYSRIILHIPKKKIHPRPVQRRDWRTESGNVRNIGRMERALMRGGWPWGGVVLFGEEERKRA